MISPPGSKTRPSRRPLKSRRCINVSRDHENQSCLRFVYVCDNYAPPLHSYAHEATTGPAESSSRHSASKKSAPGTPSRRATACGRNNAMLRRDPVWLRVAVGFSVRSACLELRHETEAHGLDLPFLIPIFVHNAKRRGQSIDRSIGHYCLRRGRRTGRIGNERTSSTLRVRP